MRTKIEKRSDWWSLETLNAYRYPNGNVDFGAKDSDEHRWHLTNEAKLIDGIWRWNSNGRPVPASYFYERVGGVSPDGDLFYADIRDLLPAGQAAAEKAANDAFLKEYRSRPARKVSAEEAFEIDANFEPGARVVDVFTGRTVRVVPR